MKCVVTGAAGFIGSLLCESLGDQGHEVVGLDAFLPYYARTIKERNMARACGLPNYRFVEVDLRTDPLDEVMADAEVIFHLAAMPGLRRSWIDFDTYWTCNVLATQRLLEAARDAGGRLPRIV